MKKEKGLKLGSDESFHQTPELDVAQGSEELVLLTPSWKPERGQMKAFIRPLSWTWHGGLKNLFF